MFKRKNTCRVKTLWVFLLSLHRIYENATIIVKWSEKMNKMIEKYKNLYQAHREVIDYIFIGVCTTIISIAIKWGLLFTCLDRNDPIQLQIAVVLSWIFAVLFAYVTNRKIVFKSKSKNILKEMTMFFGARVITLLIEAAIMWFFINFMGWNSDVQVMIATLVAQVVVLVSNYLFSKLFIFKNNKK